MDNPIEAFVAPHLATGDLRRVTLSGTKEGSAIRKAVIRPVEIQGRRHLQLVTYDARRATTTNTEDANDAAIAALLRAPFRNVVVELATEILEGRITKKGRLVTSRTRRTEPRPPDLAHDRAKDQPVAEDAPFLAALGLAVDGRVKPTARAKYRQINEFVRLLDGGLAGAGAAADTSPRTPLHVVDLGCGNAYLTFAVAHHLTDTRDLDARVVGVDRNAELVARNNARAQALGWAHLTFEVGDIETYEPHGTSEPQRANVVVALHACDTATDHAIAAMVKQKADLGLFAPCCHHHVQAQLRKTDLAASDALLVRHGILGERMGDVITDTARATILRLLGYDVDVVEFVAPEHTPKNTLIRAARRDLPIPAGLRAAYDDLTSQWAIEPLLAQLLAEELGGDHGRPHQPVP